MVDISSQNNKINITVSSSGNTANTNVTPDYAQYYSEKSKEWATSNRIVDNIDYSSKYYANESKKQADISTAKAAEVVESGNTAVSNIESARDNAITNVNTAGATQVALATEQATIATNKTSEVVASGNEALTNIATSKNNAITSITNQETTSKTSLIDEGATQIGLIQNEGATQVANVQSTGFYMRDDKLYYINSQGEETEFGSDDIARIEEQLATKTDMLQASSAGMPSNRYIDLTLGASGTTYTAPANGLLCLTKQTNDFNQYVQFNATSSDLGYRNNILTGQEVYNTGALAYTCMPMLKGQSTQVFYSAGGTTYAFRFIYAEGAQ